MLDKNKKVRKNLMHKPLRKRHLGDEEGMRELYKMDLKDICS